MYRFLLSIFLAAAVLTSANVSAQKTKSTKKKKTNKENVITATSSDGEEIEFTIVDDSPDKLNKLYLGVDYAECELGYPTMFLLKGVLNAKYFINNQFLLSSRFSYAYLDATTTTHTEEEKAETANLGMHPFYSADIGGIYMFASSQKTKNTNIVLSEGTYGNTRTTTILKIPSRRIIYYGARLGYYFQQNSISDDIASSADLDNFETQTSLYAVNTHSIYAGICLFNTRNIKVQSDKFGESARSGFTQVFADVLVAPSIRGKFYSEEGVDPFLDQPFIPLKDEIKGFSKTPVGARIGLEKLYYHKSLFQKFGIETGVRPGYSKLVNFYLAFHMGIGFTH